MRTLSKTKLLAYRQCPKRLWLEIHKPELREDSTATQVNFSVGNRVGDLARQIGRAGNRRRPDRMGTRFEPSAPYNCQKPLRPLSIPPMPTTATCDWRMRFAPETPYNRSSPPKRRAMSGRPESRPDATGANSSVVSGNTAVTLSAPCARSGNATQRLRRK